MIIYNVTINVEEASHDAWMTWMKDVHLPDVMATGLFVSHKMFRLLSKQEDETGFTYAIQYSCVDLTTYETYQMEHAPRLQADTLRMFGGKFVAFRTLLEEV